METRTLSAPVADRAGVSAPRAPIGAATDRPRRPKPRPKRRWPAFLVGILLVGALAWFLRRHGHAAAPTTPGGPSGELATVIRGRVEKSVDSSGKVVSNLDVDIKCRASGEVVQLPFDISQTVKKGELLCQLDPKDATLAVQLAEATVAQAVAKVAQAQANVQQAELNLQTTRERDEAALASAKVKAANLRAKVDRYKNSGVNLTSQEERETAETEATAASADERPAQIAVEELRQQEIQLEYKRQDVKTAEAQLQADRITLESQKQQLAYTTVTAPVDGTVSALNVQKGTIIASGMNGFSGGTTILTLSDLSRVFVTATVDESDIGEVRVDQPARVTVASFPGRTFAGRVVRIATKGVNTSNVVTFKVKVEVLDDHKDLLKPEMTGSVAIIQAQRDDVLTVPAAAVVQRDGYPTVTLATGERRPVEVGLQGGETAEITSGLHEGDRVAVPTTELPTRWKNQERGPGGGPPPQ